MSEPPFQRIEELFHQAVELDPERRAAFLDAACAGDAALRAAVQELLDHDVEAGRAESFLASPIDRPTRALTPDDATLPQATGNNGPPPAVPGYELLEELGRGGMGVVYKARQISLGRLVAVKMLLPGAPADFERLARFRAEVDALARLHHPNIVPIYDVGECNGRPYFTMEYVAGPGLARVLDGHPQDVHAAARLVEVLARAVYAAHQAGIIHRDLKPANVLLEPPPDAAEPRPPLACEPRITDFGLAKDQAAGRDLTRTGTAMGTPSYMAPEQARGVREGIGPSADIYSLGSMLYEMLAGRPPFDAATPAETIAALLNDDPPHPSRLRPRLSRDLATICMKCLEKSPRRRYASALDLAEDLRRFQAGEPIRARPAGLVERAYRWCRRRPLAASLLALIGVMTVAFVVTVLVYNALLQRALTREEAIDETQRQQIVHLNVTIGVTDQDAGDAFGAVLHFTEALRLDQAQPDRGRNHRTRIAAALRQCPRLVRLTTFDRPIVCASLGPSGGWAATAGEGDVLQVWDALTGLPARAPLKQGGSAVGGEFSPDGRYLAMIDGNGALRLWDLSKGESHDLQLEEGETVLRATFHANGVLHAQISGGGSQLWQPSTREPITPPELSGRVVRYSSYSEDGRRMFTLDANGQGQMWDVTTGKAAGAPLDVDQAVVQGALSPDGGRLALIGPDDRLRVWDVVAGKVLAGPVRIRPGVRQVVFSPDGERLVTARADGCAEVRQAQTGAFLAASPRHESAVTRVRFSPDSRLVVTSDAAGGARVWEAATGRAATPPLRQGGAVAAAFGPDGRQVVTVGYAGVVCVWELPGAPESRQSDSSDEDPPAASAAANGGPRLIRLGNGTAVATEHAAVGAALRPPRPADGVVESAAFSPDGRRAAVADEGGAVRVWDTTTGESLTPPLRHNGAVVYAAFSPDGLRLVTAADDDTARVWDAVNGEALSPPRREAREIRRVAFPHDGDHVEVFCEGNVVSAWDLSPDERPTEELLALAQVLACGRIDERQQRTVLGVGELQATWNKLPPGR